MPTRHGALRAAEAACASTCATLRAVQVGVAIATRVALANTPCAVSVTGSGAPRRLPPLSRLPTCDPAAPGCADSTAVMLLQLQHDADDASCISGHTGTHPPALPGSPPPVALARVGWTPEADAALRVAVARCAIAADVLRACEVHGAQMDANYLPLGSVSPITLTAQQCGNRMAWQYDDSWPTLAALPHGAPPALESRVNALRSRSEEEVLQAAGSGQHVDWMRVAHGGFLPAYCDATAMHCQHRWRTALRPGRVAAGAAWSTAQLEELSRLVRQHFATRAGANCSSRSPDKIGAVDGGGAGRDTLWECIGDACHPPRFAHDALRTYVQRCADKVAVCAPRTTVAVEVVVPPDSAQSVDPRLATEPSPGCPVTHAAVAPMAHGRYEPVSVSPHACGSAGATPSASPGVVIGKKGE
ncbi:MAG: hypothetical protein EOO41_02990, partial [Methanobacteriota archaeon]